MGRGGVNLVVVGRHFALGRSATSYGIWRRDDAVKTRPGSPIEEFPLTDEGWAAAWAQYSAWEPPANPGQETVTAAYETSSMARTQVPRRPAAPRRPKRPRAAGWRWAVSTAASAVVIAAAAAVVVTKSPSGTRVAAKGPAPAARLTAHPATAPRATPTTVPPSGAGYLATGSNLVVFIQWTDEHGILAGTAEVASVDGTLPKLSVKTKAMNLVGAEHGSTVMLKLDGEPSAFGTVVGRGFSLNYPAADGSLVPLTFTDATAAAFDAALSTLRQQTAAADRTAVDAQARQTAQDRINVDAAAVTADINQLLPQQIQVLTAATAAVSKALAATTSDTAATQAASAAVVAEASQYQEGGNAAVCADAGGVAAHAHGVGSDAASVGAAADEVDNDVKSVRQDVSQLSGDWSKLQADEAALPGAQIPGQPTATQVSDATSAANSADAQAVSTTNGDVDQANSDVVDAFGYAATAYGAGKCGLAPAPPQPQKHIA